MKNVKQSNLNSLQISHAGIQFPIRANIYIDLVVDVAIRFLIIFVFSVHAMLVYVITKENDSE